MGKFGGLKATTVALTIFGVALTSGCGGGSSTKKKDPGPGTDAPTFESCVTESEPFVSDNFATADIVDGGLLYDKWWETIDVAAPTEVQPIWTDVAVINNPALATTSADTTWRCKSCHGWDYRGSTGAYSSGSNFTGIPGLLAYANSSSTQPIDLFCAVKVGSLDAGPDHSFGAVMADAHILNLTKFLREGLVDTAQYIDDSTKTIRLANAAAGGVLYTERCQRCHDVDGSIYAGSSVGLGEIAVNNPWEFLHKVRIGDELIEDTGKELMPSYQYASVGALSMQQIGDIIAYAQADLLGGVSSPDPGGNPGGNPGGGASEIELGGLLYDNIWSVTEGTTTVDNPIWASRLANAANVKNDRSGGETWRCKECHGWDYAGVNGAYGTAVGGSYYDPATETGTHYTGFPSLYARLPRLKTNGVDSLVAWLRDGVPDRANPGQALHAYGQGTPANLDLDSLKALATFIIEGGIIDTSAYIRFGSAAGGESSGATLYTGGAGTAVANCGDAACHGPLGQSIDFDDDDLTTLPNEYLGTLARDNPWEVLHKARFGQPGVPDMTSVLSWGTDLDASDILAHTQRTLPAQ